MKFLVLAAVIVAVTVAGNKGLKNQPHGDLQWPWQSGYIYRYDVESHTLTSQPGSAATGYAFRARFTIRVKAPGQIQARLEKPEYSQVHQELVNNEHTPDNLAYQPVKDLEKPFEIYMKGGRVLSLNLPVSVPLAQENLLKGLISALQVDLSTHRNVHSSHDTYDKDIHQGLFRKMETDVTGDCETLYTVSPIAAEWRRELPNFASQEEPIEISKSKNYGHCHHRVGYHFGVPSNAEWTGTAHQTKKDQLIKRATVSRILVAKNGPIYKAETTSTVNVHPQMYGEQNAEVHSKVSLYLVTYEKDNEPEWEKTESYREVKKLLYSLTHKQVDMKDSSSSSSSSESNEKHSSNYQEVRQRRSARPKSFVAINKVVVKRDKSSSSSSSSSSFSSSSESAYVNDDIPTSDEPAYAALYMNPQPHGDKKQNPMHAQKLVQELAQQLQNPNSMPKGDFLSKFNILVRIIASMSASQLSQLTHNIEVVKSGNDGIRADMWMIYRDAVTQSGTLPAFQQIRTWIQTKKIRGEEGSHVVSVLSKSLRYPTKEAMSQFFELAMSPEARSESTLNVTLLIAATRFINMGHVDNHTAHHNYPTHMYGRLAQQYDTFVIDDILPRLEQEMNQAIQEGDSHKSQVYIKAIGNLGHRAILQVFAPYLEGKKEASTYIRTRMVENLQRLAKQRDGHARAVLYSILRNTAEPYEVRIAAIRNIMIANPSTVMMQAMAEMTHDDPSLQVRAMLKSAILASAELKNTHFFELSRIANVVKGMLTKEQFGPQYSGKNIMEHLGADDDLDSVSWFSNVGSEDSLFPKSFKYTKKNRVGGWQESTMYGVSASSIQRMTSLLADKFMQAVFNKQPKDYGTGPNHKYSASKISEMLNIQRSEQEPLESAIFINTLNQQRLYTLNENDMEEIGDMMKAYVSDLADGTTKHYTNVLYKNQVSIMFPVASGMPFIYKYKEPIVVRVKGKAIGQVESAQNNFKVASDREYHFTYAQNYDGSVGFLDTLGNRIASVGVVTKLQIHVPYRIHIEVQSDKLKFSLQPQEPEQESTIVHYSVWPYSANQQKDSMTTVSHDPTTKLISRPNKVASFDYKFGQKFGLQFQAQGYSYSEDYRNIGRLWKSANLWENIISALSQKDVAQTHYNLKYVGKQSKNTGVQFSATYDVVYNQKQEGQMSPVASVQQDASPSSESRRQQILKRVATGINTAKARVLDLSIMFDGQQKQEYVATFAVAHSPVDPKVQFAFFAGRNDDSDPSGHDQINAVGTFTKPILISPLNFLEALKLDPKMNFDADIRFGQKQNIHIKGTGERSKQYTEELQNYPLAKLCIEQVSNDNYYQDACQNMIIRAHAPNSFRFTVGYKDLSNTVRGVSTQMLRIGQSLNLWQTTVDVPKATALSSEGKLEIYAEASYPTNTLDLKLSSQFGDIRFRDISIPRASAHALAIYWPIQAHENVLNRFTRSQYLPYCTVDGSKVRTFSGRSYEYALSRSWHVVLQDWRQQEQEQLVVLARRPTQKQLEVYISYRAPSGNDLEIEVQPGQGNSAPTVKVQSSANKVSEGELTTYWDSEDEKPILEYYTDKSGVWIMNIRENRLRMVYDGQRLVALASKNRNNNRGICGYMSGEPRDDFFTPYGLVDRPEHFGASYALNDGTSDPQTRELQDQAKNSAYQPYKRYTAILRSDDQWRATLHSSSSSSSSSEENEKWGSQNVYRSRSYLKEQGPCKVQKQVQYYENYGEICITTKPLAACQSHCTGDKYKVQGAQVVCRPKLDQQFQSYRDQIRQGGNPKVNGVPQTKQYRVPGSCRA